MLIRLEPRGEASRAMVYQSPLIAVVLTLLASMVMFWVLGTNPLQAIHAFFIEPISTLDGLAELLVKATPLVLIGIGLSLGFQANIWNIGAEGQLTLGAIFGGVLALAFFDVDTPFLLPAMLIAGIIGGMAWAAIPAFLKTRYNTNEILTSLMLTYVGLLLLSYLIHGPLRDPDGFNFPESRLFHDAAVLPIIFEGTRLHIGWLIALFVAVLAWILIVKHIIGFQIRVIGMAPAAASFAGFKEKRLVWLTLLMSGGAAGLAGVIEVAGPIGQIVPVVSPGYGFTAIIVAFLGRLHPIGVVLAGLLMALTYLGGDSAQITMNLPNAVTGVFQGMLLFFLLASDVLISYRIKFGSARTRESTA
ncbi:MAG: ABC transporter permease [Alphaproteobacteria bacterium]|nr:ABC transporter permease [Alphaproteobacteria bacterium]MCZ6587540.1 ABC transporter permease [Alphaproteobacteria bacterium]MCZ6591432.1 ABC transporter permease [Alphaproteobacteria bacterium]